MLSDSQIKNAVHWGDIEISGFNPDNVQPASYDVHLHPKLLVLNDRDPGPLDPKIDTGDQWREIDMDEDGFTLRFGQFVLGSTLERINVGGRHLAQLEGKSSLGRLGVFVHSTAGYIDPGFAGQITLELSCPHPRGVTIYPAMPIAQIAFSVCSDVQQPYNGKYGAQHGPTTSRYHENWLGGDGWK